MPAVEFSHEVTRTLATLRQRMRRHRFLAGLLRSARAVLHFGPWRHVARAVIRRQRPPEASETRSALLPALDSVHIAAALREDGVCVAGQLPGPMLARLRAVTESLPRAEYGAFHQGNEDIAALVRDPAVLEVARGYLGAEPALLECNLVVHDATLSNTLRAPRPVGPLSQRRFHFDFAGWHSLNLFVYLTDVDESSGAHEIAVGTHRSKSLYDAMRPSLEDEEAFSRFGPRIRHITGPAGTMFFEDTEAFHRRAAVTRRRVILNILFASHCSLFSRGRLIRPYQERIAAVATHGHRR